MTGIVWNDLWFIVCLMIVMFWFGYFIHSWAVEIKDDRPLFQHFRGGFYRFITTGEMEKDQEIMVVYQSEMDGRVWIRPYKEFFQLVKGYNDELVPRFKRLD